VEKINGRYNNAVLGAFTSVTPQDHGQDTTDKECIIFQLMPKFKILHQIRFNHKVCNNYLNTTSETGKHGLGFCRQSASSDQFRIWISNNFNDSYMLREPDDSFGKEQLIENCNKLKIEAIECWGFVHPTINTDLAKQHIDHQEEQAKRFDTMGTGNYQYNSNINMRLQNQNIGKGADG